VITALNPATIGGAPPLRDYVALAEKYGFGGIEFGIDEAVTLAESTSWDSVGNLFEQYGIAPAIFGLPVDCYKDDEKFKQGLANLAAKAKAATLIGCTRAGTWLPPAIDALPHEFRALISSRFIAVAEILAEYNINLALEFVGPETLRHGPAAMGKHPFIYSLSQTLEFIDDMDVPNDNIGILLDSFHWFTTHGSIENLVMLKPEQIVHVHINDAPDKPIKEQMDKERLLPGEGIINLKGFLKTLAGVGYSGFVAVETFNNELSALGPDKAAEKTEQALEHLLSSL
jgi:sugar phosphate isomerase/epimerase